MNRSMYIFAILGIVLLFKPLCAAANKPLECRYVVTKNQKTAFGTNDLSSTLENLPKFNFVEHLNRSSISGEVKKQIANTHRLLIRNLSTQSISETDRDLFYRGIYALFQSYILPDMDLDFQSKRKKHPYKYKGSREKLAIWMDEKQRSIDPSNQEEKYLSKNELLQTINNYIGIFQFLYIQSKVEKNGGVKLQEATSTTDWTNRVVTSYKLENIEDIESWEYLKRESLQSLLVSSTKERVSYPLMSSSDGKYLYRIEGKNIRLWTKNETSTYNSILIENSRLLDKVLLLPDARFLTWDSGGSMKIWEEDSGIYLDQILSEDMRIQDASLDSYGRILIIPDVGNAELWKLTKKLLVFDREIKASDGMFSGIAISPDGEIYSWINKETNSQVFHWKKSAGGDYKFVEIYSSSEKRIVSNVIAVWKDRIFVFDEYLDDVLVLKKQSDETYIFEESKRKSFSKLRAYSSGDVLDYYGGKIRIEKEGQGSKLFREPYQVVDAVLGPNDMVLSWDTEGALRLRKKENGAYHVLSSSAHKRRVSGALFTEDGNILSWTNYGSIIEWKIRGDDIIPRVLLAETNGLLIELELIYDKEGGVIMYQGYPLLSVKGTHQVFSPETMDLMDVP